LNAKAGEEGNDISVAVRKAVSSTTPKTPHELAIMPLPVIPDYYSYQSSKTMFTPSTLPSLPFFWRGQEIS
jgi:hypothetical protein